MRRLWRVHHPELPGTAGASFELGPDEAHHVRRVLRLAPGEHVSVFDGAGSEWRAVIEASERKHVRLRLERPEPGAVEPALEVVLYQALCRPDRMDWLLQKVTEVGVFAVFAFATARTGAQRLTDHRLARWRRVTIEACKQSGRRRVPRVEIADGLPPSPPPGTLGVLLDPDPGVPPLGEFCAGQPPAAGGVWIAVGPEGGFESREVASWTRGGWRAAGLGPRTLRADTAGVVAASIVLHQWGDLGAPTPSGAEC
jgi:16S rRNA (uracil1498-N3)-methyltransferase